MTITEETTILLPKVETWTEVRCPACVKLNHVDQSIQGLKQPRILLFIYGTMNPSDVKIKVKCDRCHSWITWTYGTPLTEIHQLGKMRRKRQTVAFE